MTLPAHREPDLPAQIHVPAMGDEIRALFIERDIETIVDATVGTGGHTRLLLEATPARLIGIDRDSRALEVAAEQLGEFRDRVTLLHGDFAQFDRLLEQNGIESADGVIADLGMSTFALDDPARGFSFRLDGPLDMRMDPAQPLRARDIVNEESESELARILFEFGEEHAARRIARMIAAVRRRHLIETTTELRAIVERVLSSRRRGRIHPATRTFQALRIAVNREMESLVALLAQAPMRLAPRGRLAVIAYHSLEDRAVKERFRALAHGGKFVAVTGKPLRPAQAEIQRNARARSARLRCIERAA